MPANVAYETGTLVTNAYARLMLRLLIAPDSPLPAGPKILVANHPTTTDPFLLQALVSEPVSVLVKELLFRIPGFGRYLRAAGHIPVAAGRGREAFELARRLLDDGRTLGVFPEGDLSPKDGGLGAPRTGAARLALVTGALVVPVGIHVRPENVRHSTVTIDGEADVARWYLNGPYAMTVGEPRRFAGDVEDRTRVGDIAEQIMASILTLSRSSAQRIAAREAVREPITLRALDGLQGVVGGLLGQIPGVVDAR